MKARIQEDLKAALRAKDEIKTGALRMLLAALINKEKEKGPFDSAQGKHELSDEEAQAVLFGEAKKRKEAAEAFEKGNRPDMAAKERKELEIIQGYLPEQMAEEEIRKLVKEAIAKTGAQSPQDMGKVMAALMPQTKGKADGGQVSQIVKQQLAGGES